MKRIEDKQRRKARRKVRVRGKISGTVTRPRISIFKSNKNIYVQVIDDAAGKTLASVSTMSKDNAAMGARTADAEKLGEQLGAKLKELKISEAVFDRNGNLYHGVIKAFAEGTRKAGIRM
ncbi:50S ribosomal protein L18 [Spirochaeta dissipatitropha]